MESVQVLDLDTFNKCTDNYVKTYKNWLGIPTEREYQIFNELQQPGIKIVIIQYVFAIPSMRKTIKNIEVNFAYRWYLGYGMWEEVPHFSTFGKNYTRRFDGTGLFEAIFARILQEIAACGFLDTENLFLDGTHIKASANPHKYRNETLQKEARCYEEELQKEIESDRTAHGRKNLSGTLKYFTFQFFQFK